MMKKKIIIKKSKNTDNLLQLYLTKKEIGNKIKYEKDRIKSKELRFKLAETEIKIEFAKLKGVRK
jgi:hypothetical protein